MTASKESDRTLFLNIDSHLSKVDQDLNSLIDAHTQGMAIGTLAALANAQRELRLARRYMGVELA